MINHIKQRRLTKCPGRTKYNRLPATIYQHSVIIGIPIKNLTKNLFYSRPGVTDSHTTNDDDTIDSYI